MVLTGVRFLNILKMSSTLPSKPGAKNFGSTAMKACPKFAGLEESPHLRTFVE